MGTGYSPSESPESPSPASFFQGAEGEKRNDEYLAWRKKTEAQMQKESGNRLEFRDIGSSMLLQELKFK